MICNKEEKDNEKTIMGELMMAFHGRGSGTHSRAGGHVGSGGKGGINLGGYHGLHPRFYRYYYYFWPYYFVAQLAFVVLFMVMLFFYLVYRENPNFNDPIKELKDTFISSQYILFVIHCSAFALISLIQKNLRLNFRCLVAAFFISSVMLVSFAGTKIYMDHIYTDEKFASLFYEVESPLPSNIQDKFDAGEINRVNMANGVIERASDLDFYVGKCKESYLKFTLKVCMNFGIHFLILAFNIFMMVKMNKAAKRLDKIHQEDEVLFDEEINVKI